MPTPLITDTTVWAWRATGTPPTILDTGSPTNLTLVKTALKYPDKLGLAAGDEGWEIRADTLDSGGFYSSYFDITDAISLDSNQPYASVWEFDHEDYDDQLIDFSISTYLWNSGFLGWGDRLEGKSQMNSFQKRPIEVIQMDANVANNNPPATQNVSMVDWGTPIDWSIDIGKTRFYVSRTAIARAITNFASIRLVGIVKYEATPPVVCLSHDDNHSAVYDVWWPEARDREIPFTLFINGNKLEGQPGHNPTIHLTNAELDEMCNYRVPSGVRKDERLCFVGNHTIDHKGLGKLFDRGSSNPPTEPQTSFTAATNVLQIGEVEKYGQVGYPEIGDTFHVVGSSLNDGKTFEIAAFDTGAGTITTTGTPAFIDETVNHTNNEILYVVYTASEVEATFAGNIPRIAKWTNGYHRVAAAPFGSYDENIPALATKYNYKIWRNTQGSVFGHQSAEDLCFGGLPIDPLRFRVSHTMNPGNSVAAVVDTIEQHEPLSSIVHPYGHDFVAGSTTPTGQQWNGDMVVDFLDQTVVKRDAGDWVVSHYPAIAEAIHGPASNDLLFPYLFPPVIGKVMGSVFEDF